LYDVGRGESIVVRSAANDAEVSGLPSGWHEQAPDRILELATELVRMVVSEAAHCPGRICGLGITGQMHGLLLVDGNGQPLTNLITWRDQRTAADVPGPDSTGACARTGCRLAAGYGGPTLRWLQANGIVSDGVTALSIADFVVAAFTGRVATDPTHAASWGVFDVPDNRWSTATMDRLAVPHTVLPLVLPTSMPLARLRSEMTTATGLSPDVVVCSPVGDNQAGVYALTAGAGDTLVVNVGTGGQVSVPRPTFVYRPGLETRPMPFGGVILVGATLCAGWSYAYLQEFFRRTLVAFGVSTLTDDDIYEVMNRLSVSAGSEAGELLADTRFNGTRLDPTVRGVLAGIDTANLTPANLCRSVLNGVAAELADLAGAAGLADVSRIIASGNAVQRNPALVDALADAFGRSCSVSDVQETAAVGAARAAAAGLGIS